MTDLSITPANVVPQANARLIYDKKAAVAIAAGDFVALNAANLVALADNDAGTAVEDGVGMAVNSAAAGQPVTYQTGGDVACGSVFTAGDAQYLSSTAGKLCPFADLGSGDKVVQLGIAKSATVLSLSVRNPGVDK